MPKRLPQCPACGAKLPYDRKSDGKLRVRTCPCGYSVTECITVEIREYYPESAPVPQPACPGEGGI